MKIGELDKKAVSPWQIMLVWSRTVLSKVGAAAFSY